MYQRRTNGGNKSTTAHSSSSLPTYNRGYDVEGGGSMNSGNRRPRSGGLGASDANANILEQQNNERINLLSDQVARLKGLTIEIGNEVREQNSLLDNMSDGFANTRDMLAGSLRRIGTMLQSGGAKHMCYMVTFCVAVFIFLWWLMNHKGSRGV